MDKQALLDLADRVEKLEGPNYALECEIEHSVSPHWTGEGTPKPYTASLDAAMTLVPDGYGVKIRRWVDGSGGAGSYAPEDSSDWLNAATPAIALVAAALRAIAGETEC